MSSHWAQIARRFAWQLGQKYRHLQEKASRYSWAQSSHRMRANPCSRMPQARNLSVTCATTGGHGPYSCAKRSAIVGSIQAKYTIGQLARASLSDEEMGWLRSKGLIGALDYTPHWLERTLRVPQVVPQ